MTASNLVIHTMTRVMPVDLYGQLYVPGLPWGMPSPAHTFEQALARLGLKPDAAPLLDTIYAPLASWLADLHRHHDRPIIIGVNGAQGSGKSTFCSLLTPVLRAAHDLRAVTISIDDVYHTRATRLEMAQTVHPLCGIRGVPGTHDVNLTHTLLDQLTIEGLVERVAIPRFDKSVDDRRPRAEWETVEGTVDVILFEGWCVGCPDLPDWTGPCNDREAADDPEGVWVRWSIERLRRTYRALFDRLDALLMIEVPSMETVRRGRWLQEQRLWEACGLEPNATDHPPGLMNQAAVHEYVALFERYTTHMLAALPEHADALIALRDGFSYEPKRIPSAYEGAPSSTGPQPTP